MTIYKLQGTTVQDNVASLDIQEDGVLEGVLIAMRATLNADGENMNCEVSFSSTSGFATNDTRASFAGAAMQTSLLTSGAASSFTNVFIQSNIPVSAGERIYLHSAGTAAALDRASVWLYVADGRPRVGGRQERERRGGRP